MNEFSFYSFNRSESKSRVCVCVCVLLHWIRTRANSSCIFTYYFCWKWTDDRKYMSAIRNNNGYVNISYDLITSEITLKTVYPRTRTLALVELFQFSRWPQHWSEPNRSERNRNDGSTNTYCWLHVIVVKWVLLFVSYALGCLHWCRSRWCANFYGTCLQSPFPNLKIGCVACSVWRAKIIQIVCDFDPLGVLRWVCSSFATTIRKFPMKIHSCVIDAVRRLAN